MSTRSVATAHGIVGFITCACLIIFYAAGEPFGTSNDVGNALLGLLSLALAGLLRRPAPAPTRSDRVLLGIAAVGAALTVAGTVLVVSGITGFYLAGLWSAAGFGLIGVWLVGISRRVRPTGMVAGVVMLLGLLGVPGIFMGIDDMDNAPVWTFVAGVSWAGTYLLFPAWSLRLARRDRPERLG
ncbi:hypothetical protein [Kribbella sp. NPDC000426]|uniref:hypothetical protein n=1 Tax=Kribbella sp. NPDC000426 TaxID=3154255 RepID=UPI0033300C44